MRPASPWQRLSACFFSSTPGNPLRPARPSHRGARYLYTHFAVLISLVERLMAEFAAERRMGKTRNSYTLGERTRLRTNAQICRDLSDFRAEGASLVAQFRKEGR